MALGTLASRVTGLVRQFLIVAAIGTAGIGNAYTIGLNLPNMLYILIITVLMGLVPGHLLFFLTRVPV